MNSKNITENSNNLSFKVYFYSLDDVSPRAKIREEICEALKVNRTTLYDKIRNNRFTQLEQDLIVKILELPLVALSEVNGGPWASAAEFSIVGCNGDTSGSDFDLLA